MVNCKKYIKFGGCCKDERVSKFFFGILGRRYCKEKWDGVFCSFKEERQPPSPPTKRNIIKGEW